MSCDGWGCSDCAGQLRAIAQNDYMVDGNFLLTGHTLNAIAERIEAGDAAFESERLHLATHANYQGVVERYAAEVAELRMQVARLQARLEVGS